MTTIRASRGPTAGNVPARRVDLVAGVLFAVGLLAAAIPSPAGAQPSDVTRKKLMRQIGVMESIIDQVLVDSPNFFVSNTTDNARGVYLEEFGILFSFEASLVNKDYDLHNLTIPKFDFETKDGKIIIDLDKERSKAQKEQERLERERERMEKQLKKLHDGEAPEASADPGEGDEDDEAPEPEDEESMYDFQNRKSTLRRQEKTYERGKVEILDTLLEYGDTMTGLRDDQSLGIVGFLRDAEIFNDRRISRVLFKVKMRDIRAYTGGQITEEQAKAKVSEEEY